MRSKQRPVRDFGGRCLWWSQTRKSAPPLRFRLVELQFLRKTVVRGALSGTLALLTRARERNARRSLAVSRMTQRCASELCHCAEQLISDVRVAGRRFIDFSVFH